MRCFEPPLVIKKQILPSFNNALTIHCKRSSAVVCYVCYVLKIEFSGIYALSLYLLQKLIHLMQMKMMQHVTNLRYQALAANSWIDVQPLLPPSLAESWQISRFSNLD